MANSRFEYVKGYEQADLLLPSTYIMIRIDGRGFHKLSAKYNFKKPNDRRALDLMNAAATAVLHDMPDITMAYGVSDEFSFVFDKHCNLFQRRESKITSTVVSTFTAYYVYLWAHYFPDTPLSAPLPSFDGRAVLYPDTQILRDYLSWRQADCHINNLYNTVFWAMVQIGGFTQTQAEAALQGTLAADKNEILFSKFGINYNKEDEIFKKGSIMYRDYGPILGEQKLSTGREMGNIDHEASKTQQEKDRKRKTKAQIAVEHVDLIKDEFWDRRPWLLSVARW